MRKDEGVIRSFCASEITVADLMPRFYEATQSRVFTDGTEFAIVTIRL